MPRSLNPTVLSVFGLRPQRIGGTERYCRELSEALLQRRWQSVLCFETLPEGLVRDYMELSNVSFDTAPALASCKLSTITNLRRVLRSHRPQIVHFHYTGFITPFPWLAKLYGARRVFLTNHFSPPEGSAPSRLGVVKRMLGRLINSPVNGVVCPSEFGRAYISASGTLPAARFRCIYNATRVEATLGSTERGREFRKRFNILPDRFVVTQVGQLIPEKGVWDLISAFNVVAATAPNIHLVLIGEGPLREECQRRIQSLGLANSVTFTGLLEDVEESGAYEASDLCCLTSRWQELFGFVLIEAMAHGRPIIATRVGGIPEVVAHGETGYLVRPGDVEQIARHILEFQQSDAKRTEFGAAARRRVESLFDVRKNVALLLDWYEITN